MSREFAKRLIAENKGGHIVNVLSKASLTTTTKGRACYVTNKTAQMGLTKQLAVDLTDKGIICNGIMPGTVTSEMSKASRAGMSEEDREKAYQARLKRLPMGRYGEPVEFGKMVAFLASDQCQLAVGAVIDFTGGMMLGF
jgi:NAD(P)-dependent dehydrogenase (short-subunit alcohol dehydrogenase family)